MIWIFALISLFASTVGSLCGIGGGIIIKPVLDLSHLMPVETVSFLSGCTVLAMAAFSVGRSFLEGKGTIDVQRGTPLAAGAAIGGVAGQLAFSAIAAAVPDTNVLGMAQSSLLFFVTFSTLVYIRFESRITTLHVERRGACGMVGVGLGLLSSFLGIGGGPINLMALHYFFSMERKKAAVNSLYVILFSQLCSLAAAFAYGQPIDGGLTYLPAMIVCGIVGGLIGSTLYRRLSANRIAGIYRFMIILILLICLWNFVKFAGA